MGDRDRRIHITKLLALDSRVLGLDFYAKCNQNIVALCGKVVII